ELAAPLGVPAAFVQGVVPQAVLGDRDGVALPAELPAIVELGDALRVERTAVVRLGGERHVVLAELSRHEPGGDLRRLVPERELTPAGEAVGRNRAPKVVEPRKNAHGRSKGIPSPRLRTARIEARETARRSSQGIGDGAPFPRACAMSPISGR